MMPAFPLVYPPPYEPAQRAAPQPLAAFPPALKFALSTSDTLDDDVKIDRATDGTGRARSFFISPKHQISAALTGISAAEWATFDSFYRAYRIQPFSIPWGECGAHYDLPVLFSTPPKRIFLGNGKSTVTFALVEFP